jgi:hypothetical protein
MSDTQWVYSLYIQANPVPDPAELPLTEEEGDLVVAPLSARPETTQRLTTQDARRRTPWRTVTIAFAVVILIGAVFGLATLIGSDSPDVIVVPDSMPTVSFDGQSATYAGPSTFDTNAITFVFDNNSDRMALLGWNVMNDESITIDEEIAWMDVHRGDDYAIPPWVEDYGQITVSNMNGTLEGTAEIPNGKVLLYVWQQSGKVLYPAAHIIVDTGG